MGEALSSMTPKQRSLRALDPFNVPATLWAAVAEAIATAEREAHAAGRKAERERIVGVVRSLMERFGHAKAAKFVLTDLERQIMEATDG